MTASVMPCFQSRPDEGFIIGTILAGYGELELELLVTMIPAENSDLDACVRKLFSIRGEERRITTWMKAVKAKYVAAGLGADLAEIASDMDWCRKIRNQYAHSQWYDTVSEGLCVIALEETAKQSGPITKLTDNRHPVSLALLTDQAAFFFYVKVSLWYLESAYRRAAGLRTSPGQPKPAKVARPLLHN